jgi:hypothetical protein
MDERPPAVLLSTPLPRPLRGSSTRVRCGTNDVVLEAVRGGHTLLWSDGRQARRFSVGLGDDATLTLELRAPRLPLRIVVREVLALAPGSRLRGYVQVPLVPTIVWHPANGDALPLLELPVADLAPEWDDRAGTVLRAVSPLHVRFPMRNGEPRAIVPLWFGNPTSTVASPGYVPLSLEDRELHALRGSIVASPRRLRWTGEHLTSTAMRRRSEVLQ